MCFSIIFFNSDFHELKFLKLLLKHLFHDAISDATGHLLSPDSAHSRLLDIILCPLCEFQSLVVSLHCDAMCDPLLPNASTSCVAPCSVLRTVHSPKITVTVFADQHQYVMVVSVFD